MSFHVDLGSFSLGLSNPYMPGRIATQSATMLFQVFLELAATAGMA